MLLLWLGLRNLASLTDREKKDPCVLFAVKISSAWSQGNYKEFLSLALTAPKMSGYLLDWIIDRERRHSITKINDKVRWELFASILKKVNRFSCAKMASSLHDEEVVRKQSDILSNRDNEKKRRRLIPFFKLGQLLNEGLVQHDHQTERQVLDEQRVLAEREGLVPLFLKEEEDLAKQREQQCGLDERSKQCDLTERKDLAKQCVLAEQQNLEQEHGGQVQGEELKEHRQGEKQFHVGQVVGKAKLSVLVKQLEIFRQEQSARRGRQLSRLGGWGK